MTISSISAQSPYSSSPAIPPAPRSAPPPPLYVGLEEVKNLRIQDIPKFTEDILKLMVRLLFIFFDSNKTHIYGIDGAFVEEGNTLASNSVWALGLVSK